MPLLEEYSWLLGADEDEQRDGSELRLGTGMDLHFGHHYGRQASYLNQFNPNNNVI
jgi:hypothetical protein